MARGRAYSRSQKHKDYKRMMYRDYKREILEDVLYKDSERSLPETFTIYLGDPILRDDYALIDIVIKVSNGHSYEVCKNLPVWSTGGDLQESLDNFYQLFDGVTLPFNQSSLIALARTGFNLRAVFNLFNTTRTTSKKYSTRDFRDRIANLEDISCNFTEHQQKVFRYYTYAIKTIRYDLGVTHIVNTRSKTKHFNKYLCSLYNRGDFDEFEYLVGNSKQYKIDQDW